METQIFISPCQNIIFKKKKQSSIRKPKILQEIITLQLISKFQITSQKKKSFFEKSSYKKKKDSPIIYLFINYYIILYNIIIIIIIIT